MTTVSITHDSILTERRVFVVSHAKTSYADNADIANKLIIPDAWDTSLDVNIQYLMTSRMYEQTSYKGACVVVNTMPILDDGDVVIVHKEDKRLEVVYQVASSTNSLYVTNACNSRCQFCPQPSSVDDGSLYDNALDVVDLVPDPCGCVNITGGEPTIRKDKFLQVLKATAEKWPSTKILVLTNGRALKDSSFVEQIFNVRNGAPIGFAVPLYADAANVHDSVVGVRGAFAQTIHGLYNLASKFVEIEIRIVVSQLTYKRLPNLVKFVGCNIPFVSRIAVMGIEPMGYCREKWDSFWIDPEDCSTELSRAVSVADNYGINLYLYNFQLCCIPFHIRDRACSSISEWKRVYVKQCLSCCSREICGGFFASQNDSRYRPRRFAEEA